MLKIDGLQKKPSKSTKESIKGSRKKETNILQQ